MRNLIIFIFLIVSPLALFAQNLAKLKGIVIDKNTGEPLAGVSVYIEATKRGTITDNNGNYILHIPVGEYNISFSFVGFTTKEKTVKVEASNKLLNISLEPSFEKLEGVTITGKSETRLIREQAMPIAIIDIENIKGIAGDISDVLSKTAGIQVRMSGGVGSKSRLSVRGLEGKRIGLFLDGVAISDNDEYTDINDIPVDFIERIEIYKGIVPAKLGGNAIGGAVNIVLKEYPPKYMNASYETGSFNTHKARFTFRQNKNGIKAGGGGYYTYSDNDYTMELPLQPGRYIKRDHDKYKKQVLGGSLTSYKWWFDEVELEAVYMSSEKEIQGIEYNIQEAKSLSDVFVFNTKLTKKDFLVKGLDFETSNAYQYSLYRYIDTASVQYNWDRETTPSYSTKYGVGLGEIGDQPNDTYNKAHNFYQKTNLNYIVSDRVTINFASQYVHMRGIPKDTLKDLVIGHKTNFNSKMDSWVTGLSYEYNSTNKKFTNALTAKYYYYSMRTKIVTTVLAINSVPEPVENKKSDFGISNAIRFRFTPKLLIKTSLAYDVRLPSQKELLGDGFLIQASGNLIPERNTSFNIGLMYDATNKNNKRLQVELNGFYMYLEDMIRFTGGTLQSKYVNFGEMRTLGLEIEVKWDAKSWLYLWGNATYQDLRDTRTYRAGSTDKNWTKGDRMPNIPYLFANAGFELHKENLFGGKRQNSRFFTDCSFVEEYFYDFEQSKKQERRIPRSFTVNAGLVHRFYNQSLILSLHANNIIDKQVFSEFNRPLSGRNFGLKVRYVFK